MAGRNPVFGSARRKTRHTYIRMYVCTYMYVGATASLHSLLIRVVPTLHLRGRVFAVCVWGVPL